jgi:hypothetical protein
MDVVEVVVDSTGTVVVVVVQRSECSLVLKYSQSVFLMSV